MRRSWYICLIGILGLLGAQPHPMRADVRTETFRFRHFKIADGLASNTVRAIAQDRYGFIWFGTDEGLNRYDGIEVKTYEPHAQEVQEFISTLYAADDCLWIGTGGGLWRLEYAADTLELFRLAAVDGTEITARVNHLTADKEGRLWITTDGQGLFNYDPEQQLLQHYPMAETGGIVSSIYVDQENQVWLMAGVPAFPIYRQNKATGRFEPFVQRYLDDNPDKGAIALWMTEDGDGNLWVATWESGLLKMDRRSGLTTVCCHPRDGAGATHIHSIAAYRQGELMVGSDDGLLLLDTRTGAARLLTEDDADPYALSNRFVYPVLQDHEGGVWVGTFYGGVNYLSPGAGQFEWYRPVPDGSGVSGAVISGFCEDNDGNIWIASDDGGLNRFAPHDRRFTHYLPDKRNPAGSLSFTNVHALCMDGDNLWIGTYTGGVNVLHLPTGRFRHYQCNPADDTTLDSSSSYAILRDSRGYIWVATMVGICLYDRKNDCFKQLKRLDVNTVDMDEDHEGNIWFATSGQGLYRYRPYTGEWTHYLPPAEGSEPGSGQVNCTLVDHEGRVWAATQDGLLCYNEQTDRFERHEPELPSRQIYCILEEQNVLWLTTKRGLVRYLPNEGMTQTYTYSDGLQSDQFLSNSGLVARDGKIYLGSANGFNAFYPYMLRNNTSVPPVVLTRLEVANRPITARSPLLGGALHLKKRLELSYRDNVLTLQFAALSYCASGHNRYAYKLEGFDRDWTPVSPQYRATYTNLPPGTYTFRVRGCNNDGVWNVEGARLQLVVHPPFYWNTPAKLLYLLLTGVGIALLIRTLLRRSEKKHEEEILRLNADKEKEVHEAKIKFFTMIAHEIRTPVSLIIGPLEKLLRTPIPDPLRDDLDIIDRNSQRLLYLVNQLLDFRKVEQASMQMRYSRQEIRPLLQAVCDRFRPSLTQHGIRLETEYPEAGFCAMVDSEAVTKVVSNLLTNAGKYARDWVRVSCRVCPAEGSFTISVADNGIGISPDEQQKIFHPFYQAVDNKPGTGIGLSLVKSIVDLHGGSVEVESTVGQGSTFCIQLPIEQPETASAAQAPAIRPPEDILPAFPTTADLTDNKEMVHPTLLLVDDNEDFLHFLSDNFCDRYRILTAHHGEEALQQLAEKEVALIISDWMMPVMDGVQLCRAVRSQPATSHIPFVLLTAKTDTASKVEGMDCGADAYVEKPFSVQYLESCIRNLVELRELLRQKFSQMPMVPISTVAANPTDSDFLERINELIEQNLTNADFSIDFLAAELGVSRSGLFGKIKTLTGNTPGELIQLLRLKKAARLLAEGQYRVGEVAYMVGFSTPSYFAKCFQKQFGMKPGEWMEAH